MEADEEVVAVHKHLQTFLEQYPELVKQLFNLHELDRLLLVKLFLKFCTQSLRNLSSRHPLNPLRWHLTFRAI